MSAPPDAPPPEAAKIEPTGRSTAVAVAVDLTPVCSRRLNDLDAEEVAALETRLTRSWWGEVVTFLLIGVLAITFVSVGHKGVFFATMLSSIVVTKLVGHARLKRALREEFLLDDHSVRALVNINADESEGTLIERAIRRRDQSVARETAASVRGFRVPVKRRSPKQRDDEPPA